MTRAMAASFAAASERGDRSLGQLATSGGGGTTGGGTKDAAGAGTGLAGDGGKVNGAGPSPRSPQLPDGALPPGWDPRSAQDPADGALDLGNRGSPPKLSLIHI